MLTLSSDQMLDATGPKEVEEVLRKENGVSKIQGFGEILKFEFGFGITYTFWLNVSEIQPLIVA
jgi:hypothetical protein